MNKQTLKLNDMIDNLIGLKLFHKFLKKHKININSVSTTTMVPLAMLFGKKTFIYEMKNKNSHNLRNLEDIIENEYKLNDDNLFGVYLGLFGLNKSKIELKKTIPLGILYSLYKLMQFNDSSQNFILKIYSIIGEENLKVYKHFLSIKNINSATLFPLAFILGKKQFESTIINDIKTTNSIFKNRYIRF